MTIVRLLAMSIVNGTEIYIRKEWFSTLESIFKISLFMYEHRRNEIGFHLGWLYVIYNEATKNNLTTIETAIVFKHLDDLLCMMIATRND
jgi:hypothetical protein